ncbi:MAG: AraC family transcriptional regulator [Opitutales bacterium]
MPRIAREVLIQRLYHSGLLDRLQADVRILFRKRLWWLKPEEPTPVDSVEVPLVVGAVHLGQLGFKASARKERNDAYFRWLQMATRIFAEELSSPQAHSTAAVPAKITRAAKLIRQRHRESICLGDVASAVELSRERLSRLFHETLGITYSEYLVQVRLASARQLLKESDAPITEVAYESGFQSLSQFNRHFAKLEGLSPREFRKSAHAPRTRPRVES